MIAATAATLDLPLYTRDEAAFAGIESLVGVIPVTTTT